MGILANKRGIVMGVANSRSIAFGIAQRLHQEGADVGFSYLPEERGRFEARVRGLVEYMQPKLIHPCNVDDDASVAAFFEAVKAAYGTIDFLVHSIAFAPSDDIRCATVDVSRAGFLTAMETSVYSFIATARAAATLMPEGGSIMTMTYYGGERVMPGYNLMGVAKSALESSVKYLANDLGPRNIRVNALSPGPIRTLAASAIGDFKKMLEVNAGITPLRRNVDAEDVGNSAIYLISDLAKNISGENIHIDGGFHVMGPVGH